MMLLPERLCCTCDPGVDVRGRRLAAGVEGVSVVGPEVGRLFGLRWLIPPQQQLQLLVSEETLQEVQVQSRHRSAVHGQDLVSGPEAWLETEKLNCIF